MGVAGWVRLEKLQLRLAYSSGKRMGKGEIVEVATIALSLAISGKSDEEIKAMLEPGGALG